MTLVLITQNNHNDKHRKDSRGPGLHVTLPPSTYVCDPQQSLRRGHRQEGGPGSLRLSGGQGRQPCSGPSACTAPAPDTLRFARLIPYVGWLSVGYLLFGCRTLLVEATYFTGAVCQTLPATEE